MDWKSKIRGIFQRKPKGGLAPLPASSSTGALAKKSAFSFNSQALLRKSFLYNSLAIVVCSYFVADFAAHGLKPFLPEAPVQKIRKDPPQSKSLGSFDLISSRNLFNERGLIPNTEDQSSGFDGPPVKSTLPLNLLGVIVVNDELKSVASVEDKGSNQVVAVRVNDSFGPGAVVQKIETNKLIFLNRSAGRREYIELPEDMVAPKARASAPKASVGSGIQKSSETRFQIDRGEVDKTLQNINEVLTQARCVPNFDGGRAAGYRCFQIVPGSIYDKLGMKDNDVICGINGQSINDPGKAFEIFGQLKSMTNIELCINRGGRVMNMSYDIN